MYPSRQKSKASPERQESERPYLIQNLIHLHRELEPGKQNSAHSHLKLPHATCLLQGASRMVSWQDWATSTDAYTWRTGGSLLSLPSDNVHRALLTTDSPYSRYRQSSGWCEVPSTLPVPAWNRGSSPSRHSSPQLLSKQKEGWALQNRSPSVQKEMGKGACTPIIRTQLAAETV